MKKSIIIPLVLFSFLILVDSAEAALDCQVRSNDCQSGETIVFKMSDTTNAHAELPGQTNYNYYVCCSGIAGLGNDCGAADKATVLRLSGITNAHVERNDYSPQNYFNEACLSATTGPALTCSYDTNCSNLGADYVCLASISGDTNAHVGNCTAYSTKVCCAAATAAPTDPTVTTRAATDEGIDSAVLNMDYAVGDYSPVEVRFNWKKTTDATWTNTVWVSRSVDGNYDRSLSGLDASTEYQFKAQLRYNGTEIEGDTLTFTTSDIGICQYHNVWGWAWSENIGWISFSCKNCDTDDPRPAGCPVGDITNYGVDICTGEPSDPDVCIGKLQGVMVGYAWSENIGWISFNEDSLAGCPSGSCIAEVADNGIVSGWARACAVFESECSGALDNNRGGWDGWIKLRGTAQDGSPYGTWIDGSEDPAEFREWAWSDMVIGSISFNCKEGGYDEGTGSYYDVCNISPYKVMTDFSFEEEFPEISGLQWTFLDPCNQSRIPGFSWNIDTADPYYYQFRICEDFNCGGANDPLVREPLDADEGIYSVPYEEGGIYKDSWTAACTRCCPGYDDVPFGGGTYYGQVRASYTEDGLEQAEWVSVDFTTKQHCYPYPDFSLSPDPPIMEVPTQFSDESRCYDACPTGDIGHNCDSPGTTFAWTFTGDYECVDPDPNCETARNPEVEFSSSPVTVQLVVTDPDPTGYSCPTGERGFFVRPPLPKYKEVAPF